VMMVEKGHHLVLLVELDLMVLCFAMLLVYYYCVTSCELVVGAGEVLRLVPWSLLMPDVK
jgi:hypothetical protein